MDDLSVNALKAETLFGNYHELIKRQESVTPIFQDQMAFISNLEVQVTLQVSGLKLTIDELLNLAAKQEIDVSYITGSAANLLINQQKLASGTLAYENGALTFTVKSLESQQQNLPTNDKYQGAMTPPSY